MSTAAVPHRPRGSEEGNRHGSTDREILTGRTRTMIDVTAPLAEQIHMADIAYSLANQQRFTGHCPLQPSIAAHSFAVTRLTIALADLPPGQRAAWGLRRAALMHDAGEFLVSDLSAAVKQALRAGAARDSAFDVLEARANAAIIERFDCSPDGWEEIVHEADCLACAYELRAHGWYADACLPDWVATAIEDCYQHSAATEERLFVRIAAAFGMADHA